jgi:hypothetical protein
MSQTRTTRAVLVATVLVAALLAGCSTAGPATLVSAWPEADSERTVERPAELVRWPLTGLLAPDADSIVARAVAVKIENSAASRPQSNLDRADVVYETLTEGDVTRFSVIYHSQAPEVVGPVRSARLSDVYLVPQYDALFAHVGGNAVVIGRVRSADIDDVDQFYDPGPYWRSSARPRPHNMYTSIPDLRELGVSKGFDASRTIQPFAFDFFPREATPTITQVTVPFAPGNKVTWDYASERGTYLRAINGSVHSDAVSGEQIAASNVVVVWARTATMSKTDVTGSATLDIDLNGNGRVAVFRGGRLFDGIWETDGSHPPVFRDDAGEEIRLAPGNTWVQVISTTTNISMK